MVAAPLPRPPQVTLTHRDGAAFAAASDRGHLGIDRERPALRSAAFLATWFSETERSWAGADAWRQTAVWCVKEAVLKALGTGMALDPRQVSVATVRGCHVQVALGPDAAARHAALGGGAWCITLGSWEGDVVAAATLGWGDGVVEPAGSQPLSSDWRAQRSAKRYQSSA